MKRIFSSFSLKIIAIVTMTIDHIGYFLFPNLQILRIIGRISFPLIAFLVAVSMHYSSNKKRYFSILLLLGIIFSLASYLLFQRYYPNIFLTLGLGALGCYCLNKNSGIYLFILLLILGFVIWQPIQIMFGLYGILLIFLFYLLMNNKEMYLLGFIILTIVFSYINKYQLIKSDLIYCNYMLLALPFIYLYNGKRGYYHPYGKYLFYLYYPLHLLIIYGISKI